MKLNQNQVNKIIQHISLYAPFGIKCPVCGNTHWLINDTIFQATEFTGPTIVLGNNVALSPLIMITCERCQHTMLFNAIKMGLIGPDGEILDRNNEHKEKNNE